MSTENTPSTDVTIVVPVTGEVASLGAASPGDLADYFERLEDAYEHLAEVKAALIGEVTRRADRLVTRKLEGGGVVFEVNAPTEELYEPGAVRRELQPLIDSGALDPAVMDKLITRPKPKVEPERVDKRVVNTLKRSDDRALLAALGRARHRAPARRTAKVVARVVEKGGDQ